jgi:acetyltransferase-like isoleucine patch superfamily enzyme
MKKKIQKIYAANIHLLKPKNLFVNIFTKGKRFNMSKIILFGNCYVAIHKSAKINLIYGHFAINRFITKKDPFVGNLEMYSNSQINVNATFFIHSGCDIMVFDNATLNLGSGYINRYCKIRCYHNITIGNNVAISENFTIWDDDAHKIEYEGYIPKEKNDITIGDNVWIGTNVTVLKGVNIGNGCVIAAGSLVTKSIPENALAAGIPAKVIKNNVNWK